jgi:hypothetical protein
MTLSVVFRGEAQAEFDEAFVLIFFIELNIG